MRYLPGEVPGHTGTVPYSSEAIAPARLADDGEQADEDDWEDESNPEDNDADEDQEGVGLEETLEDEEIDYGYCNEDSSEETGEACEEGDDGDDDDEGMGEYIDGDLGPEDGEGDDDDDDCGREGFAAY
ncbi:hypothetical protein DAEQUDRAFT_770039 [Daedalea quercina L-15889]|uniref:Uncharacterized protein n=1 Tax=Daedalea quercina L-15889 TaxID=1314783 RepID=A0A165L850_9APHY|nr:hypothetical protein DAEQUDRAFT_770039 [Daedalea quercina L-15889]